MIVVTRQTITIGFANVRVVINNPGGVAHMPEPGGPGSPGFVSNVTVDILNGTSSVGDSTARTAFGCYTLVTTSLAAASGYDARWTIQGDTDAYVQFTSVTSTWTPA